METVLLIASEAEEYDGLARRLAPMNRISLPVRYARTVEHRGRQWLLMANGPGYRLASAALRTVLKRMPVAAVVSAGYCGGLDRSLKPLNIFVASKVVVVETGAEFPAANPPCGRSPQAGLLASQDRVAVGAEEKRALREKTGASAVDMESSIVAEFAFSAGVPFYCVRVVTDAAEDSFTLDFNNFRDEAGRFRKALIMREALRKPGTHLGPLLALRRRCRHASKELGEYLAGCDF